MMQTTLRSLSLLVAGLVLTIASHAQLGLTKSVQQSDSGVTLQSGSITLRVEAISASAFRVRYSRDGNFSVKKSFAVVDGAVKPFAARYQENDKQILVSTGELTAVIDRDSGRLTFVDTTGDTISQDMAGFPVEFHGNGFRVYKAMPKDEHYFGLGEKGYGLDLRDGAFTNWNTDVPGWHYSTDPLYHSIPFFMGLRKGKAYGVFLDNTYRTSFDFGKQAGDMYSFGSVGGELDYYFFYGPDPKAVVMQYTALVGRTPLPPRFALGYQQSRYSYHPETKVYEIAARLRADKIPTDAMYLDIDYLDGYRPFDINRKEFPTFEKMVADLKKENINLVVISDLHIAAKKGYKPYDEGTSGDMFVKNPDGSVYVGPVWPGPSVFPDFTLQRARDWYGSLYGDFVKMGVRGFWNDMNEPSVFVYPEKTMPLDTVHRVDDGSGERKADHREIHNVFGFAQVHATYDGLRKLAPEQRPFVLTRAGFSGSQRYAATWTGDNTATWEHYRLQIPTLLSMGISGYGFVGDDIGGFSNSPPADLATRWFEVGAFTPLYRDHNSNDTLPKEPWVHGPVHEAIRRHYIEERYRLLPYLYTLFEENSRTGLPIMRPLFLEYPTLGDPAQPNADWVGNDSEFLLGRDLLIAPAEGETLNPTRVILPPGEWYDYWTGQKMAPKQQIELKPKLEELPVFVRAGAILPREPLTQSTAEVPNGPLELRVYPGPDCRGSLYWDAGDGFEYLKGAFYRQEFTCQSSDHGVNVTLGAVEGSYQPWWKTVRVVVYGNRAAKSVAVNGKTVQSQFAGGASAFDVTADRGRTAIEVTY